MEKPLDKLVRAIRTIRRFCWRGWQRRREWWNRQHRNRQATAEWLRTQKPVESLGEFSYRPLISILMPVYNVDERWLRAAIESVVNQTYPHWELCIADDASPSPHIRRVLDEHAARDARIKVVYREENGHISRASNTALEMATGEFVGLLDHDDELTPDALFHVVATLQSDPSLNMLYSDEDSIDEAGERSAPSFKPAWSRDLFYSVNYVTHFAVYRAEVVKSIGGFRIGFEGSQDYDLAFRVIERVSEESIAFVPRILYHWRAIRGSVALAGSEKPYAHERARTAIREHFERTGVEADVIESRNDLHRVVYRLPSNTSVDLILKGDAARPFEGFEINVQAVPENASAEALNEAVTKGSGDVILLLDGDLVTPSADQIRELIAASLQTDIGAAAGKIIDTDGIVEQAGLVLASDLSPAFAHGGYPSEEPGNVTRNISISNYLAVTRSCMAIRRSVFTELGGFDTERFTELFDIDFCLRLWEAGKRVVVLPHVEFIRSPASRPRPAASLDELSRFQERWRKYVAADPFCNSALKRDGSFEM